MAKQSTKICHWSIFIASLIKNKLELGDNRKILMVFDKNMTLKFTEGNTKGTMCGLTNSLAKQGTTRCTATR